MIIYCDFIATDRPNYHRCRQCGFTIGPTRFPPEKCRRECDSLPLWMPNGDRGLGDTIARWLKPVAKLFGLHNCGGCKERQSLLNRWWPYSDETKIALAKAEKTRVLFRFPHGLGDCVQLTSVLLHLQELVPNWEIDIASRSGTQSCFTGLCRDAYVLGQEPRDGYDIQRTLNWYEPQDCYPNCPATKAERCLREVFSIEPVPNLCRYEIRPTEQHRTLVDRFCHEIGNRPYVLIHYQGNSAKSRKDFDARIIHQVVRNIAEMGKLPVLLDWNNRSEMFRNDLAEHIISPGNGHWLWGKSACGDAGAIAALAEKAELCIGIDSGPGHIFGATQTPTLIVWTFHHPLHYFGLAPNVTHLVPLNHESLIRTEKYWRRKAAMEFFKNHYQYRIYRSLNEALPATVAEKLVGPNQPLIVDGDCWIRDGFRDQDMVIVRDVYIEDCYRFRELRQPPKFVVDVGAHIGSFARVCHCRSKLTRVACVEANAANIPCLKQNVGAFGKVFWGACTYEPGDAMLAGSVFDGSENTGGSTVASAGSQRWDELRTDDRYRPESQPLPKWTLETILAETGWPRIDLLKLDCEGSEYSILGNADLDGLGIATIVGEYHNKQRFQQLVQERFATGWSLEIMKDGPIGLFRLRRNRAKARP